MTLSRTDRQTQALVLLLKALPDPQLVDVLQGVGAKRWGDDHPFDGCGGVVGAVRGHRVDVEGGPDHGFPGRSQARTPLHRVLVKRSERDGGDYQAPIPADLARQRQQINEVARYGFEFLRGDQ